jgi:predicted secreted protein
MKTKTSVLILGLVTIAVITAGTVIGMNLSAPPQKEPWKQQIFSLTDMENNTVVSMKIGDELNITLPDYGDGGYIWNIVHNDESIVFLIDQFNSGSSGLLGDFGHDTWVFSARQPGSSTIELRCQRPFGEQDVCQMFIVTVTVQ